MKSTREVLEFLNLIPSKDFNIIDRIFDPVASFTGGKEGRRRVFLCHANEDKSAVFDLYNKLKLAGHQPWLDKEDLLPGQEWAKEIPKAIKTSACVLVFLSKNSVEKRGYVQREFKLTLDTLDELPEGQVFVIPVLLDDCKVPDSFTRFQWTRIDAVEGFDKLLKSIELAVSANAV